MYNMLMELRDYQKECLDAIHKLKGGAYLVSMATGLGKTVVFSRIKNQGRVLILSHREELVHQPIKYYDERCGIEKGGVTSHGERVVSASVQSLCRRLDRFKPDDFDLIITDEAHHAAAPSYKKIYSYFKPRLHLGFTATPNRGDKVRLDDVYSSIIFERNLKWGIEKGYLTDVRCLRAKVNYDLRRVKTHMGDFQVGDLDRAMNREGVNQEVARVYKRLARGQTLIFATSVEHAENIAACIPGAVAVSQKTVNRSRIIEDFTKKRIKCLVNCMIFTEGTDLPLIETIIIARPTKNASLYAQMVGRGLRHWENKEYLTLIDLVGVSEDLDICTAPSLMGLDMDGVPKSRRDGVEGMLSGMQAIIEGAADCPENWILNVSAVNLFAREQGVDTLSINWTKKPNGDLVYQFATGDRIGVKAVNSLGETKVMYYLYSEELEKFVYSESEEMSFQWALRRAYEHFIRFHPDEKPLWSIEGYYRWQHAPATEKQLSYIDKRLTEADKKFISDRGFLSKGEANQIINMINLRDLTPKDLLRLRKKKLEDDKKRQEELEERRKERAQIKTYMRLKHKKAFSYYAISHKTAFYITDDWMTALEIIGELNSLPGAACTCKKFPSIKKAREHLERVYID